MGGLHSDILMAIFARVEWRLRIVEVEPFQIRKADGVLEVRHCETTISLVMHET